MFVLTEIKKNPEGIAFDRTLDIKEELLQRNPEILDVTPVHAWGRVAYDDGFYLLNYQMAYTLTLPSSRSMTPVALQKEDLVNEVFVEEADLSAKKDLIEEDLVLVIEGASLSLTESVIDNILLDIPLSVLTEEEATSDDMPSGNSWSVMTESQYEALQAEKKAENNPFAALNGLFED